MVKIKSKYFLSTGELSLKPEEEVDVTLKAGWVTFLAKGFQLKTIGKENPIEITAKTERIILRFLGIMLSLKHQRYQCQARTCLRQNLVFANAQIEKEA